MKMNFLAEHIGASQLGYMLINTVNKLVKDGHEAMIFINDTQRPCVMPQFSTMQIVEAWGQHGIMVATSLDTAIRMMDFPGPDKKFYYVWDLEWLRGPQHIFGTLSDLFSDEELNIIARNELHTKAIENCFNITVNYIVNDFDKEQLLGVLQDGQIKKSGMATRTI